MPRPAERSDPKMTPIGDARRRVWFPRDPGLAGSRRAVRAALVMPIVFAWTKLAVGDIQIATFAACCGRPLCSDGSVACEEDGGHGYRG